MIRQGTKDTNMNKKNNKKNNIKAFLKAKKSEKPFLTFGNLNPDHVRILVLVVLIIFVATFVLISYMRSFSTDTGSNATSVKPIKVTTPLDKEITKMVAGYPIEQMTPYILKQDPKTAMFLIAIAKKESAWGERKPVLNGQDCYNYWGFRLKTDKMGSGGHTCFDSPQQAVDTVASRIDQMVNQENIQTPKDMIVWKCGYGCQDSAKTPDEKKWISDVNYYYSDMNNYL